MPVTLSLEELDCRDTRMGEISLRRRLEPTPAVAGRPPDDDFTSVLRQVFASCRAQVVAFRNPFTGGDSTNTVYVATTSVAG